MNKFIKLFLCASGMILIGKSLSAFNSFSAQLIFSLGFILTFLGFINE